MARDPRLVAVVGVHEGNEGTGARGVPWGARRNTGRGQEKARRRATDEEPRRHRRDGRRGRRRHRLRRLRALRRWRLGRQPVHRHGRREAEDQDGPPSAAEVTATATTFLTSWQQGRVDRAAAATDDTAAATALLTGWTKDAHVTGATLTPGTPTGAKVPFSVKGTVTYKGVSKPLAYDSALTVVRDTTDGTPHVDWHASVVHPDLADGDTLVTGASGTPPVTALDRQGGEITEAKYPSLGTVLDGLREKYGKTAGGKAGVELRVVRGKESKAKKSSDKTLLELSKGTPGTVRTTLSPTLQAAAERQVANRPRASVVVTRVSTGEVLAVANSGHGFNTAFQGSLAPGSTMKVITSSLLIEKDLASADKVHPCPKTFRYGGWTFHNDDDFEIKKGTFKASFARSCNTAFISQAGELDDDSLTQQAQQVFGLSLDNWSVGVPTFDGSVPVQSAAQKAASLIGQGGVRMNPLNMASVAATVKSGSFHQPYLVSPRPTAAPWPPPRAPCPRPRSGSCAS